MVVVFNDNSSADEGECTWSRAVGKVDAWREEDNGRPLVSGLSKSNEALRKVSS